ncbi:MAG TPA: glucose 1-dehydrogenase [Candidatus Methylacidiphilales bacterium]
MKKLEGKIAVVTGASKGIGASIAKHLAAEGATVVVNYASSKKGADIVVEEITKAGGKAIAVGANVAKKAEIEHLFAETKKAYGHVDILVNNAGIYEFKPLEEITEEHFQKQFNLNVLGLLLTTQEAVKHFTDKGGSIINLSSVAARGIPTASVYSATKGAVNTITSSLARELGAKKIRVNGIAPGMVVTEGTEAMGITAAETDFRKQYEAQAPLGRIGQPKDIATAVTFLASEDASWVTGETWYVSGGY